jgi:Transposase DDE domain
MWVRIISYRLTDERLGEVGTVYRLATTLLNPRVAPADVLLELYHERWEVELVIDEIKTHERAQRKVLRSRTPDGVIQEIYGVFLGHYAVRAMMAQAAMQTGAGPRSCQFYEGDVSTRRDAFFFPRLGARGRCAVGPTFVSPSHTGVVTTTSFARQSPRDKADL